MEPTEGFRILQTSAYLKLCSSLCFRRSVRGTGRPYPCLVLFRCGPGRVLRFLATPCLVNRLRYWGLAFFISLVWRFSIEALVSLNIIAGYGIYCLLERFVRSDNSSKPFPRIKNLSKTWKVVLILFITIVPLLVASWGQMMIAFSTSNTSASAQQQTYVYNAIMWLGSHTETDSVYLSVSDWRFTYTNALIGRTTVYDLLSTPSAALEFATLYGYSWIIVSQWIVGSSPLAPGQDPWYNFPQSSTQNLTLVYSNPDVEIFRVS
jgi:hypothetical protein